MPHSSQEKSNIFQVGSHNPISGKLGRNTPPELSIDTLLSPIDLSMTANRDTQMGASDP